MFTLNCRGRIIVIDNPLVLGIINATPDSFFPGSRAQNEEAILQLAKKMIAEGADIIDIGGQSTRPGSKRLGAEEESQRVLPVINMILQHLPGTIISIDTYHSSVASAAIKAGALMVNDISGGTFDAAMLTTIARLNVPYICMHLKGTPETMHQEPFYENVLTEVLDFFIEKIEQCRVAGLNDLILDPGFGFGKKASHNFQLLKNLSLFQMLGKPLLAGLSRKSTIYKTLGITANEALNGSTVLNTLALQNGASILRVHDVKEARETVTLFQKYTQAH